MFPSAMQLVGAVLVPVLLGLLVAVPVKVPRGVKGVIAVILSLAVAFLVTEEGKIQFPPTDAVHWLLFALPLVLAAGVVDASLRLWSLWRWGLIGSVSLLLVVLLSTPWRNNAPGAWADAGVWMAKVPTLAVWGMVGVWTAATTAVAMSISRRFSEIGGAPGAPMMGRWERVSVVISTGLLMAMSGPVLASAGSALSLPLRTAALGLPLLGVVAVLVVSRHAKYSTDLRGIGWVVAVLWCAIQLVGMLYFSLDWWVSLLMVIGTVAAGIATRLMPADSEKKALRRGIVCFVLTILPPTAAVVVSIVRLLSNDTGGSDYY